MAERTAAPVLALVFNAFVWGVSWLPFRMLQERGVHPLWSTALIYFLSLACLLAVRPAAWRGFGRASRRLSGCASRSCAPSNTG